MTTAALPLTTERPEGPYWVPGSPEKGSFLEPGMEGTRLTLSGMVTDSEGEPLANTWLDFWQVDSEGNYDFEGYRLRGHQYTDDGGRYRLETILPRAYTIVVERDGTTRTTKRTAHLHVKVKAPGKESLTTELYFPDETENSTDYRYGLENQLNLEDSGGGKQSVYDFVLPAGRITQVDAE